ncbi:MAG: hypothetical protein ABIQ31_02305 [Ferruginibacter sp.]
MKSDHPIFLKSVGALIFTIALGVFVFLRAGKSKGSFQQISGVVIACSNSNKSYPGKDTSRYRYLQIDNFYKTFELFIGKSSGDFKPQLEKLDILKAGDSVTVFFDTNFDTPEDPVNRLAYFIDKDREPVFIKGGGEKPLAYVLVGLSLATILALVILRKKGKIT